MATSIMTTEELLKLCGIPTDDLLIQDATIELGDRLGEPVKVNMTVIPKTRRIVSTSKPKPKDTKYE